MKVYLGAIALIVAGFFYTTAALYCNSGCAGCWKDNDLNGVDTLFRCNPGPGCLDPCPTGYHGKHCKISALPVGTPFHSIHHTCIYKTCIFVHIHCNSLEACVAWIIYVKRL